MLSLNMAVPATPRNSFDFSSEGLVNAAVLGLTDSRFNTNTNIQFITNMDGFPNSIRLEDDVTRIKLQAVSGVVLTAIGLWYDDYIPGTSPSPVTKQLINVLTYTAGVTANDTTFKTLFPFVQTPLAGTYNCNCETPPAQRANNFSNGNVESTFNKSFNSLLNAPEVLMKTSPNPFVDNAVVEYQLKTASQASIAVFDEQGKQVKMLVNKKMPQGSYTEKFNGKSLNAGIYFLQL